MNTPFYVIVDTHERVSGNPDRFTWQYNTRNIGTVGRSYRCALKKLEFPAGCVYQINQFNNKFLYNIGVNNPTCTVEPGNYTAQELISVIQAHITAFVAANTLATTITMSYDQTRNKFGFTRSNTTLTCKIFGSDFHGEPEAGMHEIVGLGPQDLVVGTTVTYAPNCADMSPLDAIYLTCNQGFSPSYKSPTFANTNILYRISLAAPRNAKQYIDETLPIYTTIDRLNTSWEFGLVDHRGRPISTNGIEYGFVLQMEQI
jgi:hypothetical protein